MVCGWAGDILIPPVTKAPAECCILYTVCIAIEKSLFDVHSIREKVTRS